MIAACPDCMGERGLDCSGKGFVGVGSSGGSNVPRGYDPTGTIVPWLKVNGVERTNVLRHMREMASSSRAAHDRLAADAWDAAANLLEAT